MTRRHPVLATAALLAVLAFGLLAAWLSRPSPLTAAEGRSSSLVVVGVGGLTWSQVNATQAPTLWGLLRDGSAATLATPARVGGTCVGDTWAQLGAGRKVAGTGVSAPAGRDEPCPPLPEITRADGSDPDASSSPGPAAVPGSAGLLGEALAGKDRCVSAIGPGAAVALADATGEVARYQPLRTDDLIMRLAGCDVTVIDAGTVASGEPATAGAAGTAGTTGFEQVSLETMDQRVRDVLVAAPSTADVLVVGLTAPASGVDPNGRMPILVATGPTFPPGTLWSASTQTPGLAQLSDVTATILSLMGESAAAVGGGQPLYVLASSDNSEATAASKRTLLLDHDLRASAVAQVGTPFITVWLAATTVGLVMVLWFWARARPWDVGRSRLGLLRTARRVGLVTAAMPAATLLANLLPWWRLSSSTVVLTALLTLIVAAIASALAVGCVKGPWRTSALGPMAACALLTATVIGGDLVVGSRLQDSSVFGLQPLVGGRFHGMSPAAFALFASAVIVAAACVAAALRHRGARVGAAAFVLALGALAVAVDALAPWGDDLIGPFALVPALLWLALRTLGQDSEPRIGQVSNESSTNARASRDASPSTTRRNRWSEPRAAGAVLVTTIAIVALLGTFDMRRDAGESTWPGRLVRSILDGDAWTVARGQVGQVVDALSAATPLVLVGLVLLVPMVLVLVRPGTLATRPWRELAQEEPLVRDGLLATIAMGVIALFTHEGGVLVLPVTALFVFPLALSTVVHYMRIQAARRSIRRRADRIRV